MLEANRNNFASKNLYFLFMLIKERQKPLTMFKALDFLNASLPLLFVLQLILELVLEKLV